MGNTLGNGQIQLSQAASCFRPSIPDPTAPSGKARAPDEADDRAVIKERLVKADRLMDDSGWINNSLLVRRRDLVQN